MREILKQDRLKPLPATFHLAWMIAFNAGLLDTAEIKALPALLAKIEAGLAREPQGLDTAHDAWLTLLGAWLSAPA